MVSRIGIIEPSTTLIIEPSTTLIIGGRKRPEDVRKIPRRRATNFARSALAADAIGIPVANRFVKSGLALSGSNLVTRGAAGDNSASGKRGRRDYERAIDRNAGAA